MIQIIFLNKLFAVCFGWLPKTRTLKAQKIVTLLSKINLPLCVSIPTAKDSPATGLRCTEYVKIKEESSITMKTIKYGCKFTISWLIKRDSVNLFLRYLHF